MRRAVVPVENIAEHTEGTSLDTGMYKVVIITKLSRYDKIKKALNKLGVTGITVTQVTGCGLQKGAGQIFVYPVSRVVKIRTGEEDYEALQDVE